MFSTFSLDFKLKGRLALIFYSDHIGQAVVRGLSIDEDSWVFQSQAIMHFLPDLRYVLVASTEFNVGAILHRNQMASSFHNHIRNGSSLGLTFSLILPRSQTNLELALFLIDSYFISVRIVAVCHHAEYNDWGGFFSWPDKCCPLVPNLNCAEPMVQFDLLKWSF